MEELRRKRLSNKNLKLLTVSFLNEFDMNFFILDLIELIDRNKLEKFIVNSFNENFTYEELYFTLKKEVQSKEELKELIEQMDHDFIELKEEDYEEYNQNN